MLFFFFLVEEDFSSPSMVITVWRTQASGGHQFTAQPNLLSLQSKHDLHTQSA